MLQKKKIITEEITFLIVNFGLTINLDNLLTSGDVKFKFGMRTIDIVATVGSKDCSETLVVLS